MVILIWHEPNGAVLYMRMASNI